MASLVDNTLAPGRAGDIARPGVSLTDGLLLLMSIIWGVNYVVVKYGAGLVDPLAYNGIRVAVAAVILTGIVAVMRGERLARRDLVALLWLGVLGNGVYQAFFVEGIARTRAGDAALVLAAAPAFIAILGRVWGVERLGARAVGGIVLSIAGIALVVFGATGGADGASTLLGNALVLAGCLCWAVYTVLLKPYTNRISALRISAVTAVGGAVPLLIVALPAILSTNWRTVPAGAFGAIAYSAIGALVIAYLFCYRGIRVLGPTRTAMYGNLQPIIAILVAWGFLHEVPTLWQWVGAVTIIAGVVMTRT
jgi:drug/metabolite transporter (DMT)-like permease